MRSKKGAFVYQQVELTTAEWATDTTIYPASIWLFERLESGKFDMKLSDGVHMFSELPAVMQDITAKVKTSNETTYILTITTATGSFDTPNLKGKDAATVAIDPDTKHMLIGGVDTGVKVEGVDGKSAFELWQEIEGNADKTIVDFYVFLKGEKGDAFSYADFTVDQIEGLKVKGDKGDAFKYADFTTDQIEGLKLKFSALTDEDKAELKGEKGDPFKFSDFTEDQLNGLKGQDGQSAYLDAVAKGYAGTKDEFDTLLAGIDSAGLYDLPIALADINEGSTSEEIRNAIGDVAGAKNIVKAIQEKKILSLNATIEQASIVMLVDSIHNLIEGQNTLVLVYVNGISAIQIVITFTAEEFVSGVAFVYSFRPTDSLTETTSGTPLDAIAGRVLNERINKSVIPTDIFIAPSLNSLSPTKYSQIFTYTTATAQPINFSATPAEGFECMLDIKNGTSSNITQAIPNATGWQTEDTSVVLPAGKITSISIRRVHGVNMMRI